MSPTGRMTTPPKATGKVLKFTGAAWFRRKVAELGKALQRLPPRRPGPRPPDLRIKP
jgi:hypothetical protein